jgi:DNA-binding HxlR family transcriptional regulator
LFLTAALSFKKGFSTRTLTEFGREPLLLVFQFQLNPGHPQLARFIPQASGKVLTAQLRELERDGIIRRKIFPTVPPKVEYSLTVLGESLRPVLKALADWGQTHVRKRNPA